MMTHNLPVELSSFVGRGEELASIERLVCDRRLVTLTGTGGCGKTRLAVALCTRLIDSWSDGVWLIDLGSVTDPTQIPRLTASTLGVLLEPGGDQLQALVAKLRQRRMLLCFDTCEHLLDATAALTDTVLRGCPSVSILATSREPLGVEGEAVWRVPSLKEEEAAELFAERATLAAPGFDADAVRSEVRAVCTRVDNIPLAVELAAAWVRALSAAQIASGLDDCFRLLAGGPRRAIPRHQTLLASMAWSHALLEDDEKVVFRRLAVFVGGFSLDAVEAVCGDGGVLEQGALAMVGRLVDKSLVTVRESESQVRYRLLDTVRLYAEERLRSEDGVELVRDRHLDYYLDLAERAQPGLESDQDLWRQKLDSHHDNINAALDCGLSQPDDRADRGRRLAAAMARQWFIRGQSGEGLGFLRRAIDLRPTDRSRLQGRLLAGTAMLGMVSGRLDLVAETTKRGLDIAGEVGDELTRARCLAMAAWPAFFVDFEVCQALTAQARLAGESAGDPFSRDWATVLEAYTLTTRDRHDEAVALARPAFERSSPRGDRFCASFARGVELWATLETGDVRAAVAIGRELLEIATPVGDYFAVGTMAGNLALATGWAGDIAEGRKIMEPIVRSVDDAPDVDVVAYMHSQGMLHLWDGDLDEAVRWLERGIQRMIGDDKDWTATRCLPGMAAALRRLGRVDEAAKYAAKAVALATEYGSPYVLADALDEQARLVRDADPGQAQDLHHKALALRRDNGLRTYYVDSLDALAYLEARAENYPEAARLLAASEAAREVIGCPRPPVAIPEHDAVLTSLRSHLGNDEFEALWRDSSATSLDDAVAAVTRRRGPRNRPQRGWASLTPTELDVVRLLSRGLSNPDIAGRLYMSRATVKAHLSHIYAKVGVANRTELATLAARHLADELLG